MLTGTGRAWRYTCLFFHGYFVRVFSPDERLRILVALTLTWSATPSCVVLLQPTQQINLRMPLPLGWRLALETSRDIGRIPIAGCVNSKSFKETMRSLATATVYIVQAYVKSLCMQCLRNSLDTSYTQKEVVQEYSSLAIYTTAL